MNGSLKRVASCVAALVACLALASPVVAQTSSGTVSGTITSDDGTAIRDANVSLRGNGASYTVRSDDGGRFSLSALAPGVYDVRIRSLGYNELSGRSIGVRAADVTDVTFTLSRTATSLLTIGRTTTNRALSTSSAPSTTIDTQAAAREGFTRVSDVLGDDISTTLVHPLGGGSTALPTSIALRGPDPTETLIDVDGHRVNSGNTGDFDLSLLDPADDASIELVRGISPSSLIGPDTIDGAINIRTLEPTATPHGLLRLTGGSFGAFGETVQSTGTIDRLGYAFSLHRTTTNGEVNQTISDANNGGALAHVGSGLDASTSIGKLRYAFGRGGDGYAELSIRDQSQVRDLSAALSTTAASASLSSSGNLELRRTADRVVSGAGMPTSINGYEGTSLLAHNAGYGLDVRTPIGAPGPSGISRASVLYRHYSSYVGQSVTGPGADLSPYLYNDRDRIDDDTLEIERPFSNSSLTLQYVVREERLATDFERGVVNDQALLRRSPFERARTFDTVTPTTGGPSQLGLAQTQRAALLRYTYDPTATLHLTAAGYYSRYSLFGTSVDPRFGAVFTPDARSAIRLSVGTTYQSPQLPELFVAPLPLVHGSIISTGNPNLKPDRATEFGLGFEHLFDTGAHRTDVSLDLYRVNLRTPSATLVPNLTDANCGSRVVGGDGTACPLAFPVNAGDAVYQGFELSGNRIIAPYTTLRAGYALRSAYLSAVSPDVQNGSLVVGEQTLGLPLQKWTVSASHAPPRGFSYRASLVYEGLYNELHAPQYATLDAGLGYRLGAYELSAYGTNLTNVYDQRFTSPSTGLPYGGIGSPVTTNRYALQGTAASVALTRRF